MRQACSEAAGGALDAKQAAGSSEIRQSLPSPFPASAIHPEVKISNATVSKTGIERTGSEAPA